MVEFVRRFGHAEFRMFIKRILVVLAVVALAGVLVWAICAPKPQTNPFIRLPNGDMTRLVWVTYGSSNTLVMGRPYQKYLYRLLPAKIKSWSGAKAVVPGGTIGGMSSNTPQFWMEEVRRAPAGGRQSRPSIASLDEFGTEVVNQSSGMTWAYLSQTNDIATYEMEPYGPRGRVVGIIFYDSAERSNRLATFLIPGTKLQTVRPTGATALAEVYEPGLRFQLMSLVTGFANAESKSNYIGTNGATFTQALFRLAQDGQPAKDWLPVGIEATDRDGGSVHPRITLIGSRDGNLAYNFEGTLDPAKGPWKLHIQFRQSSSISQPGSGPAHFHITVTGVPALSTPTPGWGPAHYADFSVMPVWYQTNAAGGK